MPSTPSSAASDAAPSQALAPEPGPTRRGRLILVAIATVVVVVIAGFTWVAARGSDETSAQPTCHGAVHTSAGSPSVVVAGDVAPEFTLSTLDCKTVKLSDYRGTPVVLNFWASWCTPCRKEFPLLRATNERADGKYEVLGVDAENLRSDGQQFAADRHATWTNGFDGDLQSVAKSYGVNGLPQTFFIRADGTVAERVSGELTDELIHRGLAAITKRG